MEFEKNLKNLNKAQLEAVKAIDGPVLVVAGPGTGKTQLLSMRVANIMASTDTDPSNILCLTFTNKAATNMRDRLLQLAGTEARKVTVKTFHSFAAELMNMYPDYFWNGARLSTAPDATQLEIVQSILAELPLDNPLALKFAGKYTAVNDVSRALKLAKEAGLTPEKLKSLIEVNLAYIDTIEDELVDILTPSLSAKKLDELASKIASLSDQGLDSLTAPLISLSTVIKESLDQATSNDGDSGKTTHTGKWKSRWVQTVSGQKGMYDERKRNAWWLAVADVYARYREELHKRGYYDYADMLLEVLVQLEQNPDFLSSVQERFQYVLIDEFQDSNAAQIRLAHLVADHHAAEGKPNIMAVGDDDQSIFGFNGAELNNLLFFDRNYKGVQKIVLSDNYRSSQAILDTAAQIIDQAEDRLVVREPDLTKSLKAANEPKKKGSIELISYPTREHQLSEVARDIKKRRAANKDESVVVLARGHESLRSLSSILLSLGVPVRYEQQSNILDHEAIKQILLIAEAVVALQDGDDATVNHKLSQSLRHPMWGIDALELWNLAVENRDDPKWIDSLAKSENSKLSNIAHWLLWLSGEATHQPLPLVIEYLVGLRKGEHMTSPVREYFAAKRKIDNDYLHALSAIRLLRELVNEFASADSPTLNDFVHFVATNQENGRGITDESPFVSDSDAVELYTVHKAKGLEFDAVYIIDAIEDNWQPRVGGRKPPANLPLQPPGEIADDYARLMYVAASRAKHTLIATSYYFDHAGKEILATPLVRQAIKDNKVISPESSPSPILVLEESLHWPRLNAAQEKSALAGVLESFSINVTNLLNFLDVSGGGPQYFLERNILRLPEAKTPSLAHGTATHDALELAQKIVNKGSFELGEVLTKYEDSLKREHLPAVEYERYLIHGQGNLTKLFENYELPKGSLPEQRIRDVRIGDAKIGGKLDRVDTLDESSLRIIDYKTGKPLPSIETKDQTKAVKAWKQKTQLVFYALLASNHPIFSKYKNVEGQMVYVEAELSRDLTRSYIPTDDEINRLEKLIQAVWQKVMALDLPDIKKYPQNIEGILQFEEDLLSKA